jgi:hypothetical protein
MLDNLLIQNIFAVLQTGLTAQGYTALQLAQSFQPTNQGVNTAPTLFLFKLSDHRYGFLERTDVWNPDTETMVHTETQLYETMFQISTLATQDPTNTSLPTASDYANIAAGIMNSDAARLALNAQGINIYRITDVRNPYFMDDRDRFEASPSFDFTVQHQQVITSTSLAADRIVVNVDRV